MKRINVARFFHGNRKPRLKFPLLFLLVSFFAVIMVGLLVSSVVDYSQYKKQIVRTFSEKSVQTLSQTAYAVEFVWNWASTYAYQLYHDGDIFNYIYSTSVSQMDEFSLTRKQLLLNPLVKSIYFYNGNLQRVFSTQEQPTSVKEFYDPGVFQILKDQEKIGNLNFIPRKAKTGTGSAEFDCLSIVMPLAQEMDSSPEGAVVVNLDAAVVLNTIRSVNSFEDDSFIVLDGDWTMVADSQTKSFLKKETQEPYVRQLKKGSGYFFSRVNGETQLVSFVYSKKLNWYFVEFIPYQNIVSQTYELRNLIVFLNLLLLVLFSVFVFLLSIRYFFPVVHLADNVHSETERMLQNKRENAKDEVDYLSKMVHGILTKYKELSGQSRRNMVLARNEMLRGILTGNRPWNEGLLQKFREAGLSLRPTGLMLLLLRIDDYQKTIKNRFNEEDQELLRFSIANIAGELVGAKYPNQTVDMGGDMVALILNWNDRPEKKPQKELEDAVRETQKFVSQYLNISVSGTVSFPVQQIQEIPQAFVAVKNLSNYRLIYGKESFITPEMNPELNFRVFEYPQQREEKILECLRLRKAEILRKQIQAFFTEIHSFTYEEILMSISKLVYASMREINRMNYAGDLAHSVRFSLVRSQYEQFDTLQEIEGWVLDFVKAEVSKPPETVSNRLKEYVDRATRILQAHYTDSAITLESVSEHLRLSSNYLRKIFKESMGISFSDYLGNVRMEKAKELLVTTEVSVSEICARVGISNENYFYTYFKKHSGFTPSQYRKQFSCTQIGEKEKTGGI